MYSAYLNKIQTFNKCWYVIYTWPNFKKKNKQLKAVHCESFLPLKIAIRKWNSERKKILTLFCCCLFSGISLKEFYTVLILSETIVYVYFMGKTATVPEEQVYITKYLSGKNIEIEEIPISSHQGNKDKIIPGTLSGSEGELVEIYNNWHGETRIFDIHKSPFVMCR